jgi:mannose-6-phosphate isomerase-like protein (cupin superfamily)
MQFKEVHSDERRTIYANNVLLNGKEISIIELHKGKAIGGCKHKNDEWCMLLSGKANIWRGKFQEPMEENIVYPLPKGIPHAFIGDKDCIILEWGITTKEKQDSEKEEWMVKSINEINGN